MQLHRPSHPTRPTLPDQFKSHPELFRSYTLRLEQYYLWRSQAYRIMFSEGMGSFIHLFAISGVDIHYVAFMTGCYYLGREGNTFTTRNLGEIMPITRDTIRERIKVTILRGHLSIFRRNRYVITPEGIEWVDEQGREFYRRLLKLYDIV